MDGQFGQSGLGPAKAPFFNPALCAVGACGWFTPFISAMLAYAFFGLDALGDKLEEPFGLQPNHLPLNALVRVIEIELLEAAGETDLPQPLAPLRFVLD